MPTHSPTTPTVNGTIERPVPPWFDTLRLRFGQGEAHMFLLHGNVQDFVYPGWPVTRWLTRQFFGTETRPGRDVVLSVSIDGIAFHARTERLTSQMRRMFEKTLGLALEGDAELRAANASPGQNPDDVPLPDDPGNALAMALQFLRLARRKKVVPTLDQVVHDKEPGWERERDRLQGLLAEEGDDAELDEPLVEGGAKSAALIVDRLDLILPAPAVGRDKSTYSGERLHIIYMGEKASTDKAIGDDARNPIVMVAPTMDSVHPDVLDFPGLRDIRVPLPDYAARLAFIDEIVALKPNLVLEMSTSELATMTASLTLRDIEDVTLGNQLTRKVLLERQREKMDRRYGSVLERVETTFGYDSIGGNDVLKQTLRERVIEPMQSDDPDLLAEVPMGIALFGPPGGGKSAIGAATAHESHMPYIRIKNLKDRWVGASEQNLELLIEGVDAQGRAIIEIDEIDKAFPPAEAGGDHPVDSAMRKRMQEWLADTSKRGKRFVIVMSNYPERIDPALIRTGRVDIKAPVLPPETTAERTDILTKLLVRYGQDVPDDLQEIGELTEGWTGADLEYAVSKAKGTRRIKRVSLLEALRDAVATIVPANNVEIRRQIVAAVNACNDLSLLPERYQRERRAQQQVVSIAQDEPETERPVLRQSRRRSL